MEWAYQFEVHGSLRRAHNSANDIVHSGRLTNGDSVDVGDEVAQADAGSCGGAVVLDHADADAEGLLAGAGADGDGVAAEADAEEAAVDALVGEELFDNRFDDGQWNGE